MLGCMLSNTSAPMLTPTSRPAARASVGGRDRIFFGAFCLDPSEQRLWHGAEEIHLRPKTFGVLSYLLQNRGRLVSKQELLEALWRETAVTHGVLKGCISEIRRRLEHRLHGSHLIETRNRRGYLLTASVDVSRREPASDGRGASESAALDRNLTSGSPPAATELIGRSRDIASLMGHLEVAMRGER